MSLVWGDLIFAAWMASAGCAACHVRLRVSSAWGGSGGGAFVMPRWLPLAAPRGIGAVIIFLYVISD